MNMDYSICKALNGSHMAGITKSLLVYDIMCQWHKNFQLRVDESPYLNIPDGMHISKGIGDFHVKGHVVECFARYALLYIKGAGVIDGEILETLWSVLNEVSRSARGATLAHRTEILDDHMNHSNWKKMLKIGEGSSLILNHH